MSQDLPKIDALHTLTTQLTRCELEHHVITMNGAPEATQEMYFAVRNDLAAQWNAHGDDPRRIYVLDAPAGATQRQLRYIQLQLMTSAMIGHDNDMDYLFHIEENDNGPSFRCVPGRVGTDDPSDALAAVQVELDLLQIRAAELKAAIVNNGAIILCQHGDCRNTATCVPASMVPFARHLVTRPSILTEIAARAGAQIRCVAHSHGLVNLFPNSAQPACSVCGTSRGVNADLLCPDHSVVFACLGTNVGELMMEHILRSVIAQYGGEVIDVTLDDVVGALGDKAVCITFPSGWKLVINAEADNGDHLSKCSDFFRPFFIANKYLHTNAVNGYRNKVLYTRVWVANKTVRELVMSLFKWREHLFEICERMRNAPGTVSAFNYTLHDVPDQAKSQHFECNGKVSTSDPPKPVGLSLARYHQLNACHNHVCSMHRETGAPALTPDEYRVRMAAAPHARIVKSMPFQWTNSLIPNHGAHIITSAQRKSSGYPSLINPLAFIAYPKYIGAPAPLDHGITAETIWQWESTVGTPPSDNVEKYNEYKARVQSILALDPAPEFLRRING